MTEVARIADQMKRALEGEAWHGPSLREALEGVSAEVAAAKPVAGGHSIWEIVHHLAAWNSAIRGRIGGEHVETPAEGDWPPVEDVSEAAWRRALEWLDDGSHQVQEAARRVMDARLDEPLMEGGKTSAYRTLHGYVQHVLYHAGQIVLLKKAGN